MKSAVETISPTRVKLTIEVPVDELQHSIDDALKRIGTQITVPGFRKGKVPAAVIQQRVGREAVLAEAQEHAMGHAFEDALREHDIRPVGRPEVDASPLVDGEPMTFTAELDVRPEFDLPDFASLRVEVPNAVADDAVVDEQVDALRTRFAALKDVDRAAADGDVLLVDISGFTAEEDPVDDLSGKALSYELGTDGMLPGFDDAVRGASKGDVRTFEFTPQNGDWTDIPLTVTVVVTAVRERELPALDDDFAQLASEFDTVDELREDIRQRMSRLKRLEQGAQARQKVHEVLLDSIDIPLPAAAIAAEVDDHFSDGHGGDEGHRAEVEEQSRLGLKSQFILDKIGEQEDVSVGESELSMWLMQQAPRYGMSPDAFAQALVEAGQIPMAISDIRRAKALAIVLERATVVDADGNVVDLKALDEDLQPSTEDIVQQITQSMGQ